MMVCIYPNISCIYIYPTNIYDIRDEMSVVGRVIQLTKDYTTGNDTFKKGSIGTVIEATKQPHGKDRKLKVNFWIMIQKNTD